MDGSPIPPLQRPELPAKPRGSCLAVIAVIIGVGLVAAFSVLMIGFVWPFVIGFSILGIIAMQYLIWGWWFERIYRPRPGDDVDRII